MKPTTKGVVLALGGAILFSAKAIFIKMAYIESDIKPITFLLLRMLFSLPIFLIINQYWSRKKVVVESEPSRQDYVILVLLGVSGYYLASYFDFLGLQYVSASIERLILFTYPTIVVLFSWIILKKKPSLMQLVAIGIAYIGVALIFLGKVSVSDNSNLELGAILIFSSACTYAMYLVVSNKLIPKFGTMKFTSYAMIVSCFAVIIHCSINGEILNLFDHSSKMYVLGVMIAVFSTVLPSYMISEAIRLIGASKMSIIASVGPVSTIIMATIFLNESVSVSQLVGTVIVLIGIVIVSKSKK